MKEARRPLAHCAAASAGSAAARAALVQIAPALRVLPFFGAKQQRNDVKERVDAIAKAQRRAQNAALHSAKSELLLTEQAGFLEAEGEMERTFKFSQEELAKHVDLASARKV